MEGKGISMHAHNNLPRFAKQAQSGAAGTEWRMDNEACLCNIGVPVQAERLHKAARHIIPSHAGVGRQVGVVVPHSACHLAKVLHPGYLQYRVAQWRDSAMRRNTPPFQLRAREVEASIP